MAKPSPQFPGLLLALPIAAVLALSACSPVPKLGSAQVLRTPKTIAAAQSLPGDSTARWPADGWWLAWGDPQLDGLIEEAFRDSPDVAAAIARLRRASAQVQEAGAARLPTLDVQGNAGFEKQSYNNGFPAQFTALLPQGWEDNARLSSSLGFELDMWGKNRAALAAATSEARAAALEAAQARLLLATTIASAYADFARLLEGRDVRASALGIRRASARLISAREAQGLETRGSLRQAEALAASAQADLASADEAITIRRNQLAALVGAGPDRGLTLTRPAFAAAPPAGLPDDVTSNLIGRRPDIVASRERAQAASKRVAVAHAEFYPAVRLNAMVGLQALGFGNLLESASINGSVGPAISLPLFHGGALRARYRSAAASYDEAVAGYNRAVIDAYRQVADAAVARRSVAERLSSTRLALTSSEEAYAIAKLRYEGGLSTYLDVLTVEDRLLVARLAMAELGASARSTDIALIRALGGGYDPAAPLAKVPSP